MNLSRETEGAEVWHPIHVIPSEEDVVVVHPGCFFEDQDVGIHGMTDYRQYHCLMQLEIDNMGYDTIFPDGIPEEDSWWAAMPWWEEFPGGPWGPSEWDGGVEVVRLECGGVE